MKIKWTKKAANQLEKEVCYISKENPEAANKVATIILASISRLENMPYLGRSGRKEKIRELIISSLLYIVFYRIHNDIIQIIRIFHTSRKLKK